MITGKSSTALLGALALGAMLTMSACSPSGAPQQSPSATATPQATALSGAAAQTALAPAPTKAAVAGEAVAGEAGGAEGALVTYSDVAQHFSIGHPAAWTQDTAAKEAVKFNGGDSSLSLSFVTLPAGKDVMSYATGDVASVTAQFPGFKQVGLAPSTEVVGAVVLGFEANGKSSVTGKAFAMRGDRYYIPLSDGRLAVFTMAGPIQSYDREGIRDLALTLKVLK